MNEHQNDTNRRAAVRVEGWLTECQLVRAETQGRPVEGLTATVRDTDAAYGASYHVTFPPTAHLDLWVTAVAQAWAEAQTARATLVRELPDWMRPTRAAPQLRVIVWGQLRCGRPLAPTGVRPATILAAHVHFPGLDAATITRARQLWARARQHRCHP